MNVLIVCCLLASHPGLKSGPMLGPVEAMEATIWFQTTVSARVQVKFWKKSNPDMTQQSEPMITDKSSFLTGSIVLTDLEPNTDYQYQLVIDGQVSETSYPTGFKTQKYWEWRDDPAAFTVAIGSCLYVNDPPFDRPGPVYGSEVNFVDGIIGTKPNLMIWLGDNHYYREPEFYARGRMLYRFSRVRAVPELQPLWAACSHIAIWDDHDYGPNDSDRSYRDKYHSLEMFKAFWPNPTFGLPDTPGVFTSFIYQDVDFILLDDRFHRAPDKDPDPNKDYLGPEQLRWLKDRLLASHGSFKIVALGNQVLNYRSQNESYAHYRGEFQQFRTWLDASGVNGVIFLSGDRHFTELTKIDRVGLYPLYEYTSSPLTSGTYSTLSEELQSPLRVPGTLVHKERNFGTLSFSGPYGDRTLILRCHSTDGKVLWEHRIHQEELKIPNPSSLIQYEQTP